MGEVVDFVDKVKRYFGFKPVEVKGLIISILILAFVISFRDWGAEQFDLMIGFTNLLLAIIITTISIFVHVSGQRLWALATGYRVEFQMNSIVLFLSLILAFITNGNFWIIAIGGFMIHHLSGHRLGWFRYGINYWALGLISLAGPLATLMLLIILKTLYIFFPSEFLLKFIIFNVIYNIYSMLPIPPLDGSKIFYGSRMLYGFSLPFVIIGSILFYININPIIAILGSFVIAVGLWFLYYLFLEKNLWG